MSVIPIAQSEIITELLVELVTKHQLPVNLSETTLRISSPMVRQKFLSKSWQCKLGMGRNVKKYSIDHS